ncbi:energy transducer TonB [Treponema primitia]|uniref:energy transducer TonB n=1 Tax=Treponema primitia TaxID=88058 RepID=UPI0039815BF3
MKTDKKIKLGVIIISAALHIIILFCVVFTSKSISLQIEEPAVMSLINIAEFEEEAPRPKITVKPQVKEKPPEIIPVQEEIAETLVETEEEPVTPEVTGEAISEVIEETTGAYSGSGTVTTTATTTNNAEVSRYLQSNYNYIQRRVLNELIYPSQAKRTGIQGIVEIAFIINTDGSISDTTVRRSSGNRLLDDEAQRAVNSASPFRKPTTRVKITIPVSFKLT